MDLNIHQMFDVYTKEVRSILEMAVPVWQSGLTRQQAADIESIQKSAMRMILQEGYFDYQSACQIFGALTLEERRTNLCYKFARKNLNSENSFFTRVGTTVKTRQKSIKVR